MTGRLYIDSDRQIYVLVETSLGWVAFGIADCQCFGTPKERIPQAVDGLTFTGLKLDMRASRLIDPDVDLDT